MQLIQPETERILLRQWQPGDKAPFSRLNADPWVMQYFPSVLSKSDSDAIADRCSALIGERGWGFWAAELKASKTFLGFVGLHTPSDDLPFSLCMEIGWRLAFEHWGKGYATEAAQAALRVAFDRLLLDEVVPFTAIGNLRSQAVMKRLGMKMTGALDHPKLPTSSPLKKHCLYRITREHFGLS